MILEDAVAKELADIIRQELASLQRRVERLEIQNIDARAELKALKESDDANFWRRPSIKTKSNGKHAQQ
jgi:hypothetical protein